MDLIEKLQTLFPETLDFIPRKLNYVRNEVSFHNSEDSQVRNQKKFCIARKICSKFHGTELKLAKTKLLYNGKKLTKNHFICSMRSLNFGFYLKLLMSNFRIMHPFLWRKDFLTNLTRRMQAWQHHRKGFRPKSETSEKIWRYMLLNVLLVVL